VRKPSDFDLDNPPHGTIDKAVKEFSKRLKACVEAGVDASNIQNDNAVLIFAVGLLNS